MTNKEYADGLRAVADFYELHPEICIPGETVDNFAVEGKAMAAAVAKALRGKVEKVHADTLLHLVGNIGGLRARFIFTRSGVCEKVVVGTKVVPAHVLPAREETIIPETTIEEYEWHCGSILSPDETEVA